VTFELNGSSYEGPTLAGTQLRAGLDEGDDRAEEEQCAQADEVPALAHEVELATGLDEFHGFLARRLGQPR